MIIIFYQMISSHRLDEPFVQTLLQATALYIIFNLQFSISLQVLVHIQGSTTTVTHSENHRSTTTNDVTTGEDLSARRLHVVVDGNRILATQFEALDRLRNQRVGGYTDGYDHLIDIEGNSLALNGNRRTTP